MNERIVSIADVNLGMKQNKKSERFYKLSKAYYFNNIGIKYKVMGNYLKALDYYKKSASIKKELGERKSYGKTLFLKIVNY